MPNKFQLYDYHNFQTMGVSNFSDGTHLHRTCSTTLPCAQYMHFLTRRVYINYAFFLWRWIPDYTLKDDAWVCQYDRCSLNSDPEFWVISQDKAQIWWVALSFSGSPDKYRTSGTTREQPRQTPRYFHKYHCSSLSPTTERCTGSISFIVWCHDCKRVYFCFKHAALVDSIAIFMCNLS